MLRRDAEATQRTCADEARAMRAIPEDHPLLRMRRAIDWPILETTLSAYDDPEVGRPGWPPAVLLRMLVLEQYADLSDREVHEPVGYNLLYRAFVGLGVDESVPDDTTLVRFRGRIGEPGMREVFDALNQQWAAAGLIGTERRVLDGVHLWAKGARQSWVGLLRKGRGVIVEAVAQVDAERAAGLRAQFVPPADEAEPRDDGALPRESERTAARLAAVADVRDTLVQTRVAQVQSLLAGEGDRVVSFDDPDARWGHKAPDKPFLGYTAPESLDPDSRLITGVDVVPGNANEAMRVDTMLASEPTPRAQGAVIIGAGLYHNARTVAQVDQAQGRPCFSGLKAERVSDAFTYDVAADQMVCAEAKRSVGKVRMGTVGMGRGGAGDLYYFSMRDCVPCPRRDSCLTPGERTGRAEPRRRVYLSDVRKARVVAGEAGQAWRQAHLTRRPRIEAKFDEQMTRHGGRHGRYWGLAKVTVQVLLNALTVNAKRAVKLLALRAQAPPAIPVSA